MTHTVNHSSDRVSDELEIRAMVQRYTDASSRRDAAGVASVFTADCVWHSPAMGEHRGRDAVEGFFAEMLKDFAAFVQALLSGVLSLDPAEPDRAKGRWFVQETAQQSAGANLTVSGVYHDEYVRDAGSWRISRRRYDPLLIRADDTTTALPFPTDVPAID